MIQPFSQALVVSHVGLDAVVLLLGQMLTQPPRLTASVRAYDMSLCRALAPVWMRFELSMRLNDGAASPLMIAAMAITTISSMSEKPCIRRGGGEVRRDGRDGLFMGASAAGRS